MKAALSAQLYKSDRNDARGIAQMMRVGLYRPVHVKTLASQERRLLLTNRRLLQDKMLDIERELRGTLRNFGLKVGTVSRARFEARVDELVAPHPRLAALVRPLLAARRALREQFALMHRMLLDLVRDEPVCRRLMTAPGVGAVVALAYRVTIDVPARFERSKAVGAALGLTPRRYQSGELDRMGRISKCGDGMLRSLLFEAAQVLLTRAGGSWLKAWGLQLAKRRGMKRAIVATARRLSVILHRMWVDGSDFRFTRQDEGASA
jgi:transposase